MPVVTRSAASKNNSSSGDTVSSKFKYSGIFTLLMTSIFVITTIFLSTGAALFFHNCKIADKVWIPKSQAFCNDVALSIQNLEIRPTLSQNLHISLKSLYSTILNQFPASFFYYSKNSDEYTEKIREFFVDTFNNIGQKIDELFGKNNQFSEYMSSTSDNVYNFGKYYYDLASTTAIRTAQSFMKYIDNLFN